MINTTKGTSRQLELSHDAQIMMKAANGAAVALWAGADCAEGSRCWQQRAVGLLVSNAKEGRKSLEM